MLWIGAINGWVSKLTNGAVYLFELVTRCKLLVFLYYFSQHYASALLVIMSMEKFFALYFPLKTRSICTVHTAKWVTGITAVIFVAYDSQIFFIPNSHPTNNHCILINVPTNYEPTFQRINATLYSYTPFTIIGAANLAIIYKFLTAKRYSRRGGTESTSQALSKAAFKGTAMLITVSTMFIMLTGPVAIVGSISTVNIHPMVYAFIVIMRYINIAINGVLYIISGSRFRAELMKMFPFSLCKKSQALTTSDSTVNSTAMSNVSTVPRA